MATKKNSTPVLDNPVDEEAKAEEQRDEAQQMANLQAELAALKKENESLKRNSIAAKSDAGSMSDYERVRKLEREGYIQGYVAVLDAEKLDCGFVAFCYIKMRQHSHENAVQLMAAVQQVPANDKYFEMALPFAETLVNMVWAENFSNDYIDGIEDYDPVTNPHKDDTLS